MDRTVLSKGVERQYVLSQAFAGDAVETLEAGERLSDDTAPLLQPKLN